MRKGSIMRGAILSLVLVCGFGSLALAVAGGLKAPGEELIIEGGKRSARFSHPVHLAVPLDCAQCHHDGDHQPLDEAAIGAMENGLQLKCVSCHNDGFANEELRTEKAVFHARCKECHKNGVAGKTGPTKCNDCHVK